MTAVYERELDSQLNGLTGYVYGAIMLLFAGIYVMAFNLEGSPDFTSVLYSMKWIALITIPLLTMRSVAEERHQKTDQLLYSLPLGMTKIVLGKYLALVTVMAMPLAVMALYPLALNAAATAGHVALRSAYGALIGYFFLGMALTAIGLFISSLMENVGLAAGACFLVMLVLHFLAPLARFISSSGLVSLIAFTVIVLIVGLLFWRVTKNGMFALVLSLVLEGGLGACYALWPDGFSGLFGQVVEQLAVFDRFDNFTYDIFDLRAIVYFLSVTGVFLFLTVQVMERRRWAS